MDSRKNSFDLIRHFAALLVLYSHHYALSGLPQPTFPHWDTYGFVAVAIFFAISGFFMPASFNNSTDFIVYMTKRCRRIFPGLIVCSLIMCYIIGAVFTSESLVHYLTSPSTLKTSVLFSTFTGRPIPGVFSDFIYRDAINGSLWSLPVEFLSYIILGIALSYSNSWKSVSILLGGAAMITYLLTTKRISDISFYAVPLSYLALFGIAFSTGSLMAITQKSWFPIRWHLALIGIVFLMIFQGKPEMQVLGTASLAVLTVVFGVSFHEKLINGRFDISYGIYIYAFPIQQMVINLITHRFWLSMLISLVLTIIVASLSYRFVEKPFLYANRKTKQRQMDRMSSLEPQVI